MSDLFIGFVPVLSALVATGLTYRSAGPARVAWYATAVLVVAWTVFHGAHHFPALRTYGAW